MEVTYYVKTNQKKARVVKSISEKNIITELVDSHNVKGVDSWRRQSNFTCLYAWL